MTDERPKPKYGELAPDGWVWQPPQEARPDPTLDAGDPSSAPAAVPGASAPGTAPWPAPSTPPAPGAAPQPGAPAPAARGGGGTADRVATIALLGFGLLSTVNSVVSLLGIRDLMQQFMDLQGIAGTYTAPNAGTIGATSAVILIVVFALTAVVSVQRLRAHRLAFFVPIIGAVLGFVTLFIALAMALVGDPAIMDALTRP